MFCDFFMTFYLWKMMSMYLQKVISKKKVFCWRSMTKIAGSGSQIRGSESVPNWHGSATSGPIFFPVSPGSFAKSWEVLLRVGKFCQELGSSAKSWEVLPRVGKFCQELGSSADYIHIFPEGCERVDTSVPLATARSWSILTVSRADICSNI